MAEPERNERSGAPTGIVAALVFAAALLALLLLFRSPDGPPVGGGNGIGIGELENRVDERLDPIVVRPVAALRVRATRVVWRDEAGRTMLATPELAFSVRLGASAAGGMLIFDGVIQRLDLDLVQTAGGTWNYERVLAGVLRAGNGKGEGDGGGTPFGLRDIVLRDGGIRIRLGDVGYRATDVDVRLASAQLSGPQVRDPVFRIDRASALLELPDSAGATVERRITLDDARLRMADGALAFQVSSGTFGESTFAAAEGVWSADLGGLGVDAALTVTDGRIADVPWLPGEVPEGSRGAFRLRVEPAGAAATALTVSDASLTAPGTSVSGSVQIVLSDDGLQIREVDARVEPLSLDLVEAFTGPLPYSGDLRGTIRGTGGDIRFDLQASLAATPGGDRFQTDVTGNVAFTDAGLDIRNVTVELDRVPLQALQAVAPGLPLAGPITGTVTLEGPPGGAPLRLDLRLEAGGGIVEVAGTVDLREAVPEYDLSGRLVGVELRSVVQPAAPPAEVHATFRLEGAGFDPTTAVATVVANGTFTGWESQAGDTLAIDASVDRGLLRASTARVELGPVALSAEGEWRFAGGTGGSIRYAVDVATLETLAPYLPRDPQGELQFARGRLSAEGTLSGTLEEPAFAGRVEANEFRFGEWAAGALTGEYELLLAEGLPHADARFSGRDLASPAGAFESASVTVDFDRPDFQLAVRADQVEGGVLEVEAGGLIDETGQREIQLRRVEVDLGDQRWRLPAASEIAWTRGGAVVVEELRLVQTGGPGLVRVDGVVAPWDEMDLALEVERFPTGELVALIGSPLELSGLLSLEGTVRGPSASPGIALDVILEDGTLRGVQVSRLAATVGYEEGRLRLDGDGVLGDSARFEVTGTAPARLALGLPPSFELVEDGALDLQVTTEAFPLATLDPGIRSVRNVVGRLDAEIRVGGTPDQPDLGGRLRIADGAFTVPLLDRRYVDVRGEAALDGRILRVDSLVARSGGLARITGRLVFEQLTDPSLELTAELDGFRPQAVKDFEGAAAWGTLRLGGSLQSPRVTGDLAFDDGTLSLAPFQQGPQLNEAFAGMDDGFESLLGPDFDPAAPADGGLVVSDLEITSREDLWFATEEARAQLSGTLVVNKQGDDVTIQGTLEGEQGTFTLRIGPRLTRRFDIVSANIRFFGSPDPNPALDITASRLVRTAEGQDVDVRIRVGGTLRNPTLALAAAEGVSVPESELFCFVALARPCTEVTAFGGETALSDIIALYGVTDLITSELDVPFDYFYIGMRPGQGIGDGLYLTVGEEIDEPLDDVFLLGELPLGEEVGRLWEASLEWRIDRQWTLELAWEPNSIIRNAATGRSLPPELLGTERQFLFAIRRRWTY